MWAFGVEPKNVRQTVALHQLLDADIPAVSLMGMAGTGKTFLALAAALEQVIEQEIPQGLGLSPSGRSGPPGGRLPARGSQRETGALDGGGT